MMGATHSLMGMVAASSSLALFPDLVFYAAAGGFAGGLFPDLDLAFSHRKTLHFPVYYSLAAVAGFAVLTFHATSATAFLAYFLVSAALHSAVDVFGGGLETRPWIPSSDRAVYSHFHSRWFEPKRWIRYDGSPEDLLLSGLLALPCLLLYTAPLTELIFITLLAAALYTVLRKKIVDWAPERFL